MSVKGITYARMKLHAEDTGRSISDLAEEWVGEAMDKLGIRTFTIGEAEARGPKDAGKALAQPAFRAN